MKVLWTLYNKIENRSEHIDRTFLDKFLNKSMKKMSEKHISQLNINMNKEEFLMDLGKFRAMVENGTGYNGGPARNYYESINNTDYTILAKSLINNYKNSLYDSFKRCIKKVDYKYRSYYIINDINSVQMNITGDYICCYNVISYSGNEVDLFTAKFNASNKRLLNELSKHMPNGWIIQDDAEAGGDNCFCIYIPISQLNAN